MMEKIFVNLNTKISNREQDDAYFQDLLNEGINLIEYLKIEIPDIECKIDQCDDCEKNLLIVDAIKAVLKVKDKFK